MIEILIRINNEMRHLNQKVISLKYPLRYPYRQELGAARLISDLIAEAQSIPDRRMITFTQQVTSGHLLSNSNLF